MALDQAVKFMHQQTRELTHSLLAELVGKDHHKPLKDSSLCIQSISPTHRQPMSSGTHSPSALGEVNSHYISQDTRNTLTDFVLGSGKRCGQKS